MNEERVIRTVVFVGFLVGVIGAAITLGATVAPWAGWVALAALFLVPAVVLARRLMEQAEDRKHAVAPRPAPFGRDELSG